MVGPAHGALGASFLACRTMSFICLVAIIGMVGNFIQTIVQANENVAPVLVGTITVASITILYCIVSTVLYLDSILPFLIASFLDSALLIALIVVAVTVGRPLSYLNCQAIGDISSNSSAYGFVQSLGMNMGNDFGAWVGTSRAYCLEGKAVWGLSIALCVMFAMTALCQVFLWKRARAALPVGKGEA